MTENYDWNGQQPEYTYLAVWHQGGLESLINVTELEQQEIVARLEGQPGRTRNPIQYFILRARFNQHRHYEIYTFRSESDQADLEYMFDHNPQWIVDWIREHGNKIYSDRENRTQQVIV